MKIYVGNLSYQTTEDGLEALFSNYGSVDEAAIVLERETGRSRGFGFVTMSNDEEAKAAIEAVHGSDFEGRTLTVNEARPKAPRAGGGGQGGGQGGGYRGRGGGDRW